MSNLTLGLFSPFRYELPEYMGYDIKKFKDNIRFLSILTNRDGEIGGVCPLLFLGNVCSFSELPRPKDSTEIEKVYKYLDSIRQTNTAKPSISMLIYSVINKVKDLLG